MLRNGFDKFENGIFFISDLFVAGWMLVRRREGERGKEGTGIL